MTGYVGGAVIPATLIVTFFSKDIAVSSAAKIRFVSVTLAVFVVNHLLVKATVAEVSPAAGVCVSRTITELPAVPVPVTSQV